jgi:hypothetical protein
MPVDRWTLKRDGPPSQKIAIYARRTAHLGIGGGILTGVVGSNSVVAVVALLTGIVMYFLAFGVERRERRQERLAEETAAARDRLAREPRVDEIAD